MSDYGDDYDLDWLYVEDEYVMADELAEHVVPSPPPSHNGDSDYDVDWDRFDYYIDIEYASDGYDDANFSIHKGGKEVRPGEKRKRRVGQGRSKKRQKLATGKVAAAAAPDDPDIPEPSLPPVIWRSQKSREPETKVLDGKAETYAFFADWRERMPPTPKWTMVSPPAESSDVNTSHTSKTKDTAMTEEIGDADDEEDGAQLDPAALLAVLQDRLAAADGPLKGMDPQQLLEFAMRMANDQDAGDDIAGEMADAMLNQAGEEEEEGDDDETEGNLLSWIAQQRNAQAASSSNDPPSSNSTANRRKRRATSEATDTGDSNPNSSSKKRAIRSYDAPTAASQARAGSAKSTRSGRAKRS
ncbi:hypothetical protein BS50DRAFT_507115 [Corynespora cassiicola Philippines]|uniref:Uncharacterized protein n=1 Tax=Corynespora cassiicola Philippines TaxID=1448308 RepID=A0A2T2N3N3_CORCC|nr:hypothetical protein BS50DRAFT_507115 [Corynespora cassiicola Philippines]